MTPPSRIFLVDDHPLVREGLVNLLRGAGYAIAGEADDMQATLAHPALQTSCLVIVDLSLGQETGVELIKKLRDRNLPVLVYSMHEGSHVVRQALDAGAGGYVTKREASGSLLEAVRAVLAETLYLSPRTEKALGQRMPLDVLTGQQYNIYQLMGQGLSNEDIARRLQISVRTIESYGIRIMNKLGFQSMKELRRQAIQDATTHLPSPS